MSLDDDERVDHILQILNDILEHGATPQTLLGNLAQNSNFQDLLAKLTDLQQFTLSISNGDLSKTLDFKGPLAGSLKNLQASLRHLTWQTQQIAQGDFSQRVDFMGEFSSAFNSMVTHLAEMRARLMESEASFHQLYNNSQRQAQDLALIERVRMLVAREMDPIAVIHTVVEGIASTFGYTLVSLYTRRGDMMVLQHQVGYENVIQEIPVCKGILGKVVRTGQPVLLRNIQTDPDFLEAVPGITSEVCVPLFDRQKIVGALNVESQQATILNEADLRLLTELGDSISVAIERSRLYREEHEQRLLAESYHAELREQAVRDSLTGLFNRRYLQETLEREIARARRDDSPVSIIAMDVDFFKQINDTYGHRAGDLWLHALGNLLRKVVRQEDIACRSGGEEFVIVMPSASLEIAHQRAELIRSSVEALHVFDGNRDLHTNISMGVASFPQHGSNSDELLIRADRALYRAKDNGRNQVIVYEESIRRIRRGNTDFLKINPR